MPLYSVRLWSFSWTKKHSFTSIWDTMPLPASGEAETDAVAYYSLQCTYVF